MADDFDPDAFLKGQGEQPFNPDAFLAQPTKRTNTTIMDYPEVYGEMRRESQNQIGRGIEQLTTPTGGDLAGSAWETAKGVGNVALGALGYIGSPIAAGIRAVVGEPLEQRTGIPKEHSEFATSLLIPGIGLPRIPGSTAPNVATKIAGPSTGKIAEEARLLTKGGQETQAGMILEGAAKNPAAARAALGQVDEIVPGSQPTTFQASRDLGLGQLERASQTATRDAFIEREAAQNSARLRALQEVQETGDPEAVASHLRARMQADDVAAEAAERAAIARAEQQTQAAVRRAERAGQAAGGTNTPEIYGQILRRELDEANNAARTNERMLWQGVDPDNRFSVSTAPVMNAEFRIYRDEMTQAGAASLSDAERRIGGVIQQYGQAVPFREMQDLRSLVSGAMRQELRANGTSPSYARLSRLRGSIEESVSAPFEPGVQAGAGQAALSGDAADRLAAATAATRARAETFKQQPIRGVLQREGTAGPYPLTNAAVPGRIIPSGPKGYDHVNTYLRAVQDRPGGGLQEVTDAMVADMRAHATAVDGTIDPTKLMGWAKSKQDALRAVTERDGGALVQRLGEVEDAGRGVKTATTDQARVVKESAADRARIAKDNQVGVFGKLIGANNREDIYRLIGAVVDPPPGTQAAGVAVTNARALAARLTTPEAQQGARRAIVEYIERKYISNTAAGVDPTENVLRANAFQDFAKNSAGALREFGFTPQQIRTWQAVSNDLRQAKMSIDATKIKGGSNTPQDMLAMERFGLKSSLLGDLIYIAAGSGAGHLAIPIPVLGGAIGAALGHLAHALRARGIQNVQQLVHEAMLDPAMAHQLLLKVEGKQKIAKIRTLGMWGKRAARAEALTGSRHDQPEPAPKGYAYGGAVFPVGREGIKARNKARAFEARERSTLARSTPKAKRKVGYAGGGFIGEPGPGPNSPDELYEGQHDPTARGNARAGDASGRGRPYGSVRGDIIAPQSPKSYPMRNVLPNDALPQPELGKRTPLERRLNLDPLEQDYRRSFGAPAMGGEPEDKPYPVYAEGGQVPYPIDSPEFKEEVARALAKNQDTIAKAQEFYPRVPLNDKAWGQFIENAPASINIEDRRPGYKGGLRAAHRHADGGRVKDDSGKVSKKSVNYNKGMPKAHCGICTHWMKGTCSEVKGTIYASMWCELFKAKGKYAAGGQVKSEFDTDLGDDEEKFQTWKTQNAPSDSGADYDLRGAFKAGVTPDPETGHWPDTYKKPNHPTFSNQSQYATGENAAKAGSWEGDAYIPPDQAGGFEAAAARTRRRAPVREPSPEAKAMSSVTWEQVLPSQERLQQASDKVARGEPLDYIDQREIALAGIGVVGTPVGKGAATLGSGIVRRGGGKPPGQIPAAGRSVPRSHNMPPEEIVGPTPPPTRTTSSLGLRDMPFDEAVQAARTEQHIIPSNPKVREGYVGAPDWVKTPEDLARMRAQFDEQAAQGAEGADWYERAQGGIKEIAPDLKRQHTLSQELALTSAQATPDTNLGFALQGHNAIQAGKPLEIVRTGQIADTLREGRQSGEIGLGRKTGIYARHLDPTMENPATGTNDIWHARAFGYENPEGGMGAQQHAFMDAETVLAADRANKARLGGRDNWTPGEIQAAPWVAGKARGLEEQFGWSAEKARAEAIKTYPDYHDKYTAFGTHEATPGVGTGHLPKVAEGTEAERAAFAAHPASNWRNKPGHDILYDALGMYTRPTLPATGVFHGPKGLEINPAEVARPMVSFAGEAGKRTLAPAERKLMTAAEAARAYVDVQNAGAFSVPIPRQQVGKSTSVYTNRPKATPLPIEDVGKLQDIGGRHGLPDVIDYGQGTVQTTFGEGPTGKVLKKNLEGKLGQEIEGVLGAKPEQVALDSGYISYQSLWGKKPGSGAVTRELRKHLVSKDAPAIIKHLDASPEFRQAVLARMDRDAEIALKTGQPIRADLQRARRIITKQGFEGLFAALKRGVALPAAAFVPLVQLLQQQEGSRRDE